MPLTFINAEGDLAFSPSAGGQCMELYQTYTTIPTDEVSSTITNGENLLWNLAISAGYNTLYDLVNTNKTERILLYLYLSAIETWDVTALAWNYFDQDQLTGLLSGVQQLLWACYL
jgi:hypothetical protein